MFTLYWTRVINSTKVELSKTFETGEDALHYLYGNFFLGARGVDSHGLHYQLVETEYFDAELEQDCVRLSWECE